MLHLKKRAKFCRKYFDMRIWQIFAKIFISTKVFVKICVRQEQICAAALTICCY